MTPVTPVTPVTKASKTAVAVFVKTPGLSPLKTRLAAGIGGPAALQFYRNSLAATAEVLRQCESLAPYWAVAESVLPEDDHPWQDFPVMHQAAGGLGMRMASILEQLRRDHDRVLFIGADTPQLTPDVLRAAEDALADSDVVFGPATDGGFYLMGMRVAITAETFEGVTYSAADTRQQLSDRLAREFSVVAPLPALTDADTLADLAEIAAQLEQLTDPLPRQQVMMKWLSQRPMVANG